MATNSRDLPTTLPSAVWDVLADGWLYPLWVVGASRMREVDDEWPAVGARLHHSVGTWPLLLDDETEVVGVVPGSSLTLHAKARPTGVAEVTISLDAVGAGTRVVIVEDAISGPGRLVPKPLREVQLHWRNTETLRRLAYVAERRTRTPGS
ncbi:polyketide cyclase [Nocardioides sp. Root1257]|uniref:SRPBCC family protein n=1 Tax=unclassified Nocardioides TaxID=2615069 RepID=UPI0006F49613|nr:MULTISPECIES: SRPBCC family protein [unclassified Nocardioides]KQW43930.1 polyketide cyclase [Nocardioides sp. Root1257]KRC42371.1 polyketide cyclase [Nocardioides sp. Root224]